MNKTVGFIGTGNMGFAMINGLLKKISKEDITYTDISKERLEEIYKITGAEYVACNEDVVKGSKFVVLAVKPQYYNGVLEEIKPQISEEKVIVSIAPGITIKSLKDKLGENVRIIRAMPNTPALVNEGMTGICFSDDVFTEEEKSIADKIFSSFGIYEVVEERLMNAVVCASGSSPAYVYMFIEALADSAVKYGISRDKAYKFVAQTVLGSAKMVLETGEHPGKLKDQVCSPGGTTIAGVAALEEFGFRNSLIKATDKCYEKADSIK